MFEYLGTVLVSVDPGFDVLRYLTVRTIGGTLTALLISIILGPAIISFLKSMQNLRKTQEKSMQIWNWKR